MLRTNRINRGPATPLVPAIVLLPFVPIVLAGWVILHFATLRFQEKEIPAAGSALSLDAQAAIAGVSEFYAIDYTEPEGAWVQRMCAPIATPDDCLFLQVYFAPVIRATAEKYRIQSTSTVLPVELFSNDETTSSRIWTLQVTVEKPWPGINPTERVFAEVVFDRARQEWRFRRILFEQELQGYCTPTPEGP